jgi:hypothetical protein
VAKYQWTDWITHVPGQEMPVGTYGIWEQQGNRLHGGEPFQLERMITAAQKGHPVWRMTDGDGYACRLLRYKLRSIAAEDETVEQLELEGV